MVRQKFTLLFFSLLIGSLLSAQQFGFKRVLEHHPTLKMPFTVENNSRNSSFLESSGVIIKNKTKEYLYFTQTPTWVFKQLQEKNITNFYFEYAPPTLLDDTARVMHHVNPVHSGSFPLVNGYTGKGVIVGLVDNGLDHRHPDFIDSLGNKRVIRYWDQSITNPTRSPQPYGYGQVWSKEEIQNGTITSNEESLGHGTSVTGIGVGNGNAAGRNKGMAPESKIIFVETNFDLPNWTLTVADACDYIFRVADSLNMPAVINLSVGSYYGSHDANDPAAKLMEKLVENKPGRIIVGAAGNGGNNTPYHAQQIMTIGDTNFVWLKNNENGSFGANTIFFDLWSDIDDALFYYSLEVNRNNTSYDKVAATSYRFAQTEVGTPFYDTLYTKKGERLALLEIYTEYVGDNFHLQVFFSHIDSVDYLYRFNTTGKGKYDLWSGEWAGLNKIVDSIPTAAQYPPIVNYVLPDSAQSIISSWVCSPSIIAVANLRCRHGHITHSGLYYTPQEKVPSGKIALSSSRGPTRKGLIKPDISAAGNMTLGSAPLYMVNDSLYDNQLSELGWHVRNGGTSMASPVVAGIAALYLERCPKSTTTDFKNDLFNTAMADSFTGTVPNNRYGYGKIDAFQLLTSKNKPFKLIGDSIICQSPVEITTSIPMMNYHWNTDATSSSVVLTKKDTLFVVGRETQQGCEVFSDTLIVEEGSNTFHPKITLKNDTLIADNASSYQWYYNKNPILGATSQQFIPTKEGNYCVATQEVGGYCKSFSSRIYWQPTPINYPKEIIIFPNPSSSILNVQTPGEAILSVHIYNTIGKLVTKRSEIKQANFQLPIFKLASGIYYIRIKTTKKYRVIPFFKR